MNELIAFTVFNVMVFAFSLVTLQKAKTTLSEIDTKLAQIRMSLSEKE